MFAVFKLKLGILKTKNIMSKFEKRQDAQGLWKEFCKKYEEGMGPEDLTNQLQDNRNISSVIIGGLIPMNPSLTIRPYTSENMRKPREIKYLIISNRDFFVQPLFLDHSFIVVLPMVNCYLWY